MKNYLLAIVLFLFAATPAAFSQLDVKINPLGIIIGADVDLSLEYAVSDQFGVEARLPFGATDLDFFGLEYRRFRTGAIVSGRYYFKPEMGADNFYAGGYLKYIHTTFRNDTQSQLDFNRNRTALGLLFGYKFVSAQGIVFDINIGAGRQIANSYTFPNTGTTEEDQQSVLKAYEDVLNFFKIDVVGAISVGYRFGLGSRKGE